jgi:hypothetical protein
LADGLGKKYIQQLLPAINFVDRARSFFMGPFFILHKAFTLADYDKENGIGD